MTGRVLLKKFGIENSNSVYVMTPAFDGTVTAHIWGGGGGGGSNDYAIGGKGSSGLYNTLTFNVNKGDIIEVTIGSGGSPGISGKPLKGGLGGSSRINVGGQSAHSFNGGTGGNGPVSGAGGGGGGATTILVNGHLVMAAGGGGAGGGAGSKTNPTGKSASITYNAMNLTLTDYNGQNGQSRNDDGGTGGGGGGGYPGGKGGKSNPGDSGAESGQTGGNFPAGIATTGEDSTYYDKSYGAAGATSSKGQNGYAVLEITPTIEYASISAIKVSGSWHQVTKGYVKVSSTWRQIEASYVKKNGQWRRIVSAGEQDSIIETGSNTNYGQIQRPYS